MKAIYPGSFDPITLGHMDIIHRASKIFDLTVGIANNPAKKNYISAEERIFLAKFSITEASIHNVNVEIVPGLLANFCKENGIGIIIRGLRNSIDFEYEFSMAHINESLGDLETVFLSSCGNQTHISSSAVRELCKYGAENIRNYVPPSVFEFLKKQKLDKLPSCG